MMKQLPMTSVPNQQSYPEMGYPVAAYYGVDAALTDLRQNSASSANPTAQSATGGGARVRTLVTVVLVLAAMMLIWHFYYK